MIPFSLQLLIHHLNLDRYWYNIKLRRKLKRGETYFSCFESIILLYTSPHFLLGEGAP